MSNQCIFYGAGKYAQSNLHTWLAKGIVPVCFADGHESRQYKIMQVNTIEQTEFDVLSLKEALELYPDADVFVTIDREVDPDTFEDMRNAAIQQGVSPECVGPVPETATGKPCIFFGAGVYAHVHLKEWVYNGIVPVCVADSNQQKHHTKMRIPPINRDDKFDILPIHEAMNRYPDAFIYITTAPETYDDVCGALLADGVPAEKIGGPPQHCPYIGRQFVLNDPKFSYCCDTAYNEVFPIAGNIKDDIQKFYAVCEQLRTDLNKGKLTHCTGCPKLQPGRDDEPLKITIAILGSGTPGATKCNFRCSYCNHGMNYAKKIRTRDESILDVLQYLADHEDLEILSYACAEISVSPYRHEILKLIMEKGWNGDVLTNAYLYLDDLYELFESKKIRTIVSVDAGTPETFAKVKGVDGFHRVVENIEKYASSGGDVELKYIVLDGENCEKPDLDGFVDIAKRIHAPVYISWDIRSALTAYSDVQYGAVLYLAQQCAANCIPYVLAFDTPEYLERLKNDGVKIAMGSFTGTQ